MEIEVVRRKDLSSDHGEYGQMLIDGQVFCATCEQPWNDNRFGASCIPEGTYELLPYDSPAHGKTVVFHNPSLKIFGTPRMIPPGMSGRSLCEIHNANWPFQLRGCVAVGRKLVQFPDQGLGVNSSVATFKDLRQRLGNRSGLSAVVRSV